MVFAEGSQKPVFELRPFGAPLNPLDTRASTLRVFLEKPVFSFITDPSNYQSNFQKQHVHTHTRNLAHDSSRQTLESRRFGTLIYNFQILQAVYRTISRGNCTLITRLLHIIYFLRESPTRRSARRRDAYRHENRAETREREKKRPAREEKGTRAALAAKKPII